MTTLHTALWALVFICAALFVYHHGLYPMILRWMAARRTKVARVHQPSKQLPRIGIVMCAYNEQDYIRAKLDNLAMLDYPANRMDIHVGLDGCTDNTEANVDKAFIALAQQHVCCHKHVSKENRGKVATLNKLIKQQKDNYDILLFTDISALLSIDCLQKVVSAFNDPSVGVVSGDYQFLKPLLPEQQRYWQYQNKLKRAEGALGAVIGVPGAMFAMRARLVECIPHHTINDDFVLPMRALQQGYQAVVDPDLGIVELESDSAATDLKRRVRIGAGNIQQLWMLRKMLLPQNGWSAFNFFSGKGLRALMPLVIITAMTSLLGLCLQGSQLAMWLTAGGIASIASPALVRLIKPSAQIPILSSLEYLIANYAYALFGVVKWFAGCYSNSWRSKQAVAEQTVPLSIRCMKRTMDIVLSAAGLMLLSPVLLLTAIAVKATSTGPVLYKQLRVGMSNAQHTSLFYVLKFRSMVENAENLTGAVWAANNDPRITPIGRFLRKTRLDELPQLWNVLVGEMSLIGPRPERPQFHNVLEQQIPLFSERTYGVKPGITGLAQVKQAYPNDISGMRQKLAWDMAYSLSLLHPVRWIKAEMLILLATLKVVLLAKGQ